MDRRPDCGVRRDLAVGGSDRPGLFCGGVSGPGLAGARLGRLRPAPVSGADAGRRIGDAEVRAGEYRDLCAGYSRRWGWSTSLEMPRFFPRDGFLFSLIAPASKAVAAHG